MIVWRENENKAKETASFLSIVQLFQEEEERKNMVRIAEMQKELIKEEAQRLEGMAAWKAGESSRNK